MRLRVGFLDFSSCNPCSQITDLQTSAQNYFNANASPHGTIVLVTSLNEPVSGFVKWNCAGSGKGGGCSPKAIATSTRLQPPLIIRYSRGSSSVAPGLPPNGPPLSWDFSRLRAPWFEVSRFPVDLPWRFAEWRYVYKSFAPDIFTHAAVDAAAVGYALTLRGILRNRDRQPRAMRITFSVILSSGA